MGEDWSIEEVEAVVADYLAMLWKEKSGLDYNKAEHNRALQRLTERSKGSIEWKHQNISAVLSDLGIPGIDGYKPRFNYQGLLRTVVEQRITEFPKLIEVIGEEVEKPAADSEIEEDLKEVPVPILEYQGETAPKMGEASTKKRKGVKRNFLVLEANNRSLGLKGEEMVVEFERRRLWEAGEKKLAEKIEHVSRIQGDGLGYDILSFETNGKERLIEVKTTRYNQFTPFFASRNEVRCSLENHEHYQLCRLFHFGRNAQFYAIKGSLADRCRLEPVVYSGLPK